MWLMKYLSILQNLQLTNFPIDSRLTFSNVILYLCDWFCSKLFPCYNQVALIDLVRICRKYFCASDTCTSVYQSKSQVTWRLPHNVDKQVIFRFSRQRAQNEVVCCGKIKVHQLTFSGVYENLHPNRPWNWNLTTTTVLAQNVLSLVDAFRDIAKLGHTVASLSCTTAWEQGQGTGYMP